ncbi:hypothetical protein EBS57_07905, partial [bacterium]|nr:hypothetical protein [bacterium]
ETIGSLRGGGSTGGNVSVASGQTLTVAETGSQAFAGAITSAGGLTKSGAGTTRLSGANTYSGATTIAAGTLQVGDGGTTGAIGSTSGISISNGATLAFNRSDSYGGNFTRTISGAGGVVLSAGTLTLQNTGNSFTGGVTANGGKFQTLGNSAGNTIVVNSGGTLAMAGTDTWGNATTTTTPAITLNAGGTMTSDGFFNSIRDLTLNGGTVFLNGGLGSVVSAFTLGGTVTAGGEATSTIAVASGSNNAIRLGRQGTSESTTFNVSNANGQLSVGTVLDNNFGSISGLTKSGSGRMVLSASNTYTGGTTISGGTLELGNGGSVQGNITNHAILSMNRTDSFTLSNAISGSGAVTKSGLGTVTLTGSNTYTGLTTVSAGSLVVSNALWAATLLPGSTTVNFASVPAAGTNNLLPGPLATASLAATTFTGLGIGQTASLTNAPNLKVILSALPPANQKPVVSPGQSFLIAETSAAGTRVGTLTATDADSQAVSLTGWTLVSGNSGSAFVLNWSTGELSVQGNLDYEAVPFYTLMVTVSDGKASSDPVSVTVQVADVAEFADGFGSASAATETNAAGLPNLAAYALGAAHPNSVVPLPVLAMNTTPAATYLTLTALVRTNDPRGRLVGNATTNLASWPTNPFIAGTPTSDQTGVDPGVTQRQAFQVEVGSDTRKFLRLEAPAGMALANPLPNTATIQAQIDAAVASGQSQVRIQPGVYTNIVPVGSDPHLRLANLSNLDIDATDVTLVCSRMVRAIFIRDCTNVTLSGLTIDYVPLPMTQGTITGFGPSREWTDVRIHDGYPAPAALTNGWSFLWASDPLTRRIRPGMANRPNQSMTNMGGGVWRVAHGASFSDTAAVGDYLRIPQPVVDNTALVANRCSNLTLSNITLYSAPFHFGASFGWNDRLTLQSCRIVPGPTPPGATEPRLFSAVGDGFHFENTTGGLSILDCETDSTGDDGIAIYDMPLLVGAVADGGKTITLSFAIAGGTDSRWAKRPTAGTRFRFYVAATGTIEEGLVTNRTSSSMTTSAWTTLRNQIVPTTVPANMYNEPFVVQLQSAVSAAPGDEARLLDDPYETVVRGCRVRNSGSRGIVANTSRVRLENNQIEDTLLPAVHIKAFTKDGGPGFHDDISIRSNTITRGNLSRSTSSDFLGSICVVNWDTNRPTFGGHRRLTIEGNQIAESWGVDVQVHTASDVIVRGNRFVDSHRLSAGNGSPRAVDNTSAIFLQDVQSVLIQSNQLVRPGPYYGSQPLRTQNVTDLQAAEAFLPAQP